MAKDNNQGKQQRSQTNQSQRQSSNRSTIKGSGSAGGNERSRKGTAGDGTSSTGPRKTE